MAGALPLAVERINADSSLLPGRTLRFEWRDSGCSPSVALQALGSLAYGGKLDAVLGPACSIACEPTGYLTAGLNLAQISYSCNSPALSSKKMYPTFTRTVSSYASYAPVLTAIFKRLNWQQCEMISSTQNIYFLTSSAWNKRLHTDKVTNHIEPIWTFTAGNFKLASPKIFSQILRSGVRIVLTFAYSNDLAQIALEATTHSMIGAGWAWFGSSGIVGAELTVDRTMRERAKTALSGWLYVMPAQLQAQALAQFYRKVKTYGRQFFGFNISTVNPEATQLYNAVYLYAHAATNVLAMGGTVSNGSAIVDAMKNISFVGIGQRTVKLDINGDAIEPLSVMNYVQGSHGEMQSIEVATDVSRQLVFNQKRIQWPGNSTDTPLDVSETPVRFVLLIPITGLTQWGHQLARAAEIAVRQVNADKMLLPRHVLEYNWRDSGCSAKKGLAAMGDLLGTSQIDAVIGPACEETCKITGYLSGGRNMTQISPSWCVEHYIVAL